MPKKSYDYGSSIISTDLKFNFQNNEIKNTKIEDKFRVDLKIYCGRKKMYEAEGNYKNITIGNAIRKVFDEKIERKVTFHKGHNYYAVFDIYKLVPITRKKYQKTDTIIKTERRKYLLKERINISL